MTKISGLNDKVTALGKEIFSALAAQGPSKLSKNFWISKVMEWSMTKPEFKTNLFRLVDVLPTLRSSDAIADHVREYLSEAAGSIHGFLEWAVAAKSGSLRARATARLVTRGVQEIAGLFIAGETPAHALPALRRLRSDNLAFTVDLLGEFCVSEREAIEYQERYLDAIETLSAHIPQWPEGSPIINGHPGEATPVCVSVKLTALYSQCNILNARRSIDALSSRLTEIAIAARRAKVLLYVDAEDSANNPIIYESFKKTFSTPELKDLPYPGIVVQAYSFAAREIVSDLIEYAKNRATPIAIRLVKGAYWDFETVTSAQAGLPSPLFSKKESSDAQFEELTRVLFDNREHCLPAIASHNIRSLSHAVTYAAECGAQNTEYELQMLYGMAEPIARVFSSRGSLVRLYVPLGDMMVGMGYLVRRLLENTSNESFLRHTFFDMKEIAELLREPAIQSEDRVR